MTDSQSKKRIADLIRFYELLARLEEKVGPKRRLSECDADTGWPLRGVYFFFEPGEIRSNSGTGLRVVRVGTHGITTPKGEGTTLWSRLSGHRGKADGGGSHRASVFRSLVGTAIRASGTSDGVGLWDDYKHKLPTAASQLGLTIKQVNAAEQPLERKVSDHIRAMPFLWIPVLDPIGNNSDRKAIEQKSIALLSNRCHPLDPPSENWLGAKSTNKCVLSSGLWNEKHVGDNGNDAEILELLEHYLAAF